MTIVMERPGANGLAAAVGALRDWQYEGSPMQLHPGDLGWNWSFGERTLAAAVRTWSRDGRLLAVGLVDDPRTLRLTIAPDADRDEELADRLAQDLTEPRRGVLLAGRAAVEVPAVPLLQKLLREEGWQDDEPWSPLRRGLAEPVPARGLRIEAVGPESAPERVADRVDVQRASFDGSNFTPERWHAMAGGVAYVDARCLVAYDGQDAPVAAVTVWSAGRGRPGLLEPLGVHRDHRGRGYGTAITLAAAAALREMGASSAVVCTPSSNVGAVATYRSGGFRALPQRRDLYREG
ncbi:GNAT family N-acetyltransferase [Segeticoccus rhizosphaerae]|jgi:ribosomal protein S18 acetylase RimI-like enzyme|uniref:GNAT family N-acetyltransferase n=2 Tax=Segeticoccus rhizosphaerae TaxID=1104777 RepID=UPI0010C06D25|nr:GNAT family N-acetyltransferase [Ornithinicoccus soli]